MKKTWIILLSILLLISTIVSSVAFAGGLFSPEGGGSSYSDDSGYTGDTGSSYNGDGYDDLPWGYDDLPWDWEEGNSSSSVVTQGNGSASGNYGSVSGNYDNTSDDYDSASGDYASDTSSFSPIPVIVPYGSVPSGDVKYTEGENNGEVVIKSSSATQSLDWYGVGYDLINENKNLSVYDINTGVRWSATYINGSNHADVIPATANDSATLSANNITGSYVRRPVLVTIAGSTYAGSLYAVGHGSTSYCKHFKGVMCIHFTGSQTHGSQKVDKDHQSAIQDALAYGK